HHWHHDRDRDAGNYANISPLMDILFGTYRCPDHEPEHLGINEPTPRTYLGHMVWPFLPRKRTGQDRTPTSMAARAFSENETPAPGTPDATVAVRDTRNQSLPQPVGQ